jgi:DNA-directed RNA polymerase specialized sigma54-like protein
MNSKQWKEKLNRGSSGEDAWNMLEDLQNAEKVIKSLEDRNEKIVNIVMSGNSWVVEVAKIQNKLKKL